MNLQTLIAMNVGLPAVAALALLVLNDKKVRIAIISLSAIFLISSSILLYTGGGIVFSPAPVFETAVLVLDFALLGYFLYLGYRTRSPLVLGLALLQLVPIAYFEFVLKGAHVEHIIVVDSLSTLLTLIINVVGGVILIYTLSYMDEHEHRLRVENSRQNRFFFYMVLVLGAMNGLVYSNSLYWLYFFWEVTTLCAYALIRHDATEEAERNAVTALWMGLVGGVGLVAAMYAGYHSVHSIALTELIAAPHSQILLLGFALMALAAFSKTAQFPFHKWLLGAMVAPTPFPLIDSSSMVIAGVYLLLRIAPAIQNTTLTYVIAVMGAVTFAVTSFQAIRENVAKRVLAYSTIGNMGLILLCIGLNTGLSYTAALALMFFHSVAKGLLFMGVGIVENRLDSRHIRDWEGLLGKMPLVSKVMILGMVAMFLPPFGMLLSKWVAVDAVASMPSLLGVPLMMLVVLGSAATTFYYGKWLGFMTVLPNTLERSKTESLEAPYKLGLYTLLGLNILVSMGAAFVIGEIVNPILLVHYPQAVTTPSFALDLVFTTFPILPLWLAVISVMILGSVVANGKGGTLSPPYLSGENVAGKPVTFRTTADSEVAVNVSGVYLTSYIDEDRIDRLSVGVGIIIIALLFLVVII